MLPILDSTATIQRLVTGTTHTYSGHPTYPNPVPVNVQAGGPDLTMFAGGEAFKVFKVFADLTASGIAETDRMIINSDIYTVVGREEYSVPWGLTHYEFTCERARP